MIWDIFGGRMWRANGSFLGSGGSGLGDHWNNPSGLDLEGEDPIPVGCEFLVLDPINLDPDPKTWAPEHAHVGHYAFPLQLVSGKTNRTGFYVHGFSQADLENGTHTSSHGCIEMILIYRRAFGAEVASGDRQLLTKGQAVVPPRSPSLETPLSMLPAASPVADAPVKKSAELENRTPSGLLRFSPRFPSRFAPWRRSFS